MKTNYLLTFIIPITILLGLFVPIMVSAQEDEDAKPILFVEDGCPYCEVAKKFLEENGIDERVDTIDIREDPQNAAFYSQICENAGISLYDRGVPMLFDNEEVITSADKIIDHLGNKFDIPTDDYKIDSGSDRSDKIIFLILGLGVGISVLFLILSNKSKK